MAVADGLYSIDRGAPLKALLRVSGGGTEFHFMTVDGWQRDDDLSRHWYEPGSDWAVEVDRATAEKLAARFGRELD